jgi:hypothetical protein
MLTITQGLYGNVDNVKFHVYYDTSVVKPNLLKFILLTQDPTFSKKDSTHVDTGRHRQLNKWMQMKKTKDDVDEED